MKRSGLTATGKPYDIHERLLLFACEIVSAAQTCDPLVQESSELVKILAAIVHTARRKQAASMATAKPRGSSAG
jgi:hypothetical protein